MAIASALPVAAALWAAFVDVPEHACADGVEIVEAGRPVRIGCVAHATARGCLAVQPGDRVVLGDAAAGGTLAVPACRVDPDAMRASWMVLWGLPLDINRRSAADLACVPGIGHVLAERIVAHRERYGAFAELRDLTAVRGVKGQRLQQLAAYLKVGA